MGKEKIPRGNDGSRKLRGRSKTSACGKRRAEIEISFLKKLEEIERREAEPDTPETYLSGNQERTRKI